MAGRDIGKLLDALMHDIYEGVKKPVGYTLGKIPYRNVMDNAEPYTTQAIAYIDSLKDRLLQYNLTRDADWVLGLQERLIAFSNEIHEAYLSLEERYRMNALANSALEGLERMREKLYRYAPKKKEVHAQPSHTAAVAAILFLAVIGLGSFLFTSQETTASVVTPTVANLPLGITLLAILVIGVIMMPHRKVS